MSLSAMNRTAMNQTHYNNGDNYFVHHRPLGKKIQGYYPHVSWSDIVLQYVPVETTILSSMENEEIHYTQRKASLSSPRSPKRVGYMSQDNKDSLHNRHNGHNRHNQDIQESSHTQDIRKGNKPRHIKSMKQTHSHMRVRMIPRHKQKNYTSKPKNHEKIHRCKYAKHML